MNRRADRAPWANGADGDAAAFAIAYADVADRVRGMAYRLTGDHADADDVTAIVFFEAWRHRDRVRMVGGSPIGWLLVTTSHTASNLRRQRLRHAAALSRIRVQHVEDPSAIAEERITAAADRTLVQRAFSTLSERDQELLLLCVVEELSAAEVAAGLGATAGTVRTRLHRAKARLRVALIAAGAVAATAILAIAIIPSVPQPPRTVDAGPIPVTCMTGTGSDPAEALDPWSAPADAIALCPVAADVEVRSDDPVASPEAAEPQVDPQSTDQGRQGEGLTESRPAALVCFDGDTITVILDDLDTTCAAIDAMDVTDERSIP